MLSEQDLEVIRTMILTAYADLWAHQRALIGAIGRTGAVNDGRLEVDTQILFEEQRARLLAEARSRLQSLTAESTSPPARG